VGSDQSLWCWGANTYGAVGDNTTADRLAPARVDNNDSWLTVSAGSYHSCAIRNAASQGELWCWGWNFSGQLGDGTTTNRPDEVLVASGVSTVSAGHNDTCAVYKNGTLWCWGYNAYGQLGLGNTTSHSLPVQVGTASNWTHVSVGADHACAINSAGRLWCWGYNFDGEVGNGASGSGTNVLSPVPVGTSSGWTAVAVGGDHACAINAKQLLCWGLNANGQLGDGTTTNANVPRQVGAATDWSAVGVGSDHSCGVRSGQLWCWGYNASGQLGDGGTTEQHSPERVGTLADWYQVDAGFGHTVASRTSNT
jgi:alpha-tubulin suppressor-like RCC1 family protein